MKHFSSPMLENEWSCTHSNNWRSLTPYPCKYSPNHLNCCCCRRFKIDRLTAASTRCTNSSNHEQSTHYSQPPHPHKTSPTCPVFNIYTFATALPHPHNQPVKSIADYNSAVGVWCVHPYKMIEICNNLQYDVIEIANDRPTLCRVLSGTRGDVLVAWCHLVLSGCTICEGGNWVPKSISRVWFIHRSKQHYSTIK